MARKLDRKNLPAGLNPTDFTYKGRPASDQGDFGDDVGIVDMACVNQFGEANNSKFYHAGVVQSKDGRWFVYLEWGRVKPGKSWNGSFAGQDFQFVECSGEADARDFFADQCRDKNVKRLQQTQVAGRIIWAAKEGKDGYLVQRLATRERGLPDAYSIKDGTGAKATASVMCGTPAAAKPVSKVFQPQVVRLATDLVGGTKDYARAASAATGIVPTQAAIDEVRNDYIPAALKILQTVGNDVQAQARDKGLQDLSKLVATIVPRPIPRGGDPMSILLTQNNIFVIQQDLDAFEAAILNEDFSVSTTAPTAIDPNTLLNAQIRWVDPNSDEGKWLAATYQGMTNNRHGHVGRVRVVNMFAVARPDRDNLFLQYVKTVAARRKGQNLGPVPPGLQPARRGDLSDVADFARDAGIFLGIHGTRAVNVGPILGSNFRMPKSLSGVQITGAAFGHGIYFATDWKKSHGYTGHSSSYYGGGGMIRGRGFFMFLCDVVGGKFHYPSNAWSVAGDRCPGDGDSVYAHPRYISSLANDEHVIFNPAAQRIRYIIEGEI